MTTDELCLGLAQERVLEAMKTGEPVRISTLELACSLDPPGDRIAFKEKMVNARLVTQDGRLVLPRTGRPVRIL